MAGWSKHEEAILTAGMAANLSYSVIGAKLGKSRNAVSGYIWRKRLDGKLAPAKTHPKSRGEIKGDAEKIMAIRKCAKEGLSIKATVKKTGLSRHMVTSRAIQGGLRSKFVANGRAAQQRGYAAQRQQARIARPRRSTYTKGKATCWDAPSSGWGLNLKKDGMFLNLYGTNLTTLRANAWRGFERQIQPMIDACGIEGLKPVDELRI